MEGTIDVKKLIKLFEKAMPIFKQKVEELKEIERKEKIELKKNGHLTHGKPEFYVFSKHKLDSIEYDLMKKLYTLDSLYVNTVTLNSDELMAAAFAHECINNDE